MPPTSEEKREASRRRTQASHERRGKRFETTVLHQKILPSFPGDVEWGKLTSGRDVNEIDIVMFEITQPWYPDLKQPGKDWNPDDKKIRQPGYWDYKLEVCVHRRVGPNNEDWLCLNECFGKPCPICDEKKAEWDKPKAEQDKEKVKSLTGSWRDFYNIYDYNLPDLGIHPIEYSYALLEEPMLEELRFFEEEKNVDVAEPWAFSDGYTIEFKGRDKKLGQYTFIEPHSFNFFKRGEPYDEEETLEDAFSFDKYLYIPKYDEVAAAYYGMESAGEVQGDYDKEDEEKEETSPPRERRRSRGDRKEEKEEKEPRSRSRSRGRKREEKDDEDEPKKSRRSRRSSRKEEKEETGGECPVGGRFGTDCNELDECQDCPDEIFDRCVELQEKLKEEPEEKEEKEEKKEKKEEKKAPKKRSRRRT